MKRGHVWLGAGISAVALVLAFRQVDLGQMGAAFARVDYGLVVAAAGIQLLVVGAAGAVEGEGSADEGGDAAEAADSE